jgi:hypothetical protein
MGITFYMGNQEFSLDWVLKLQQWFEVKSDEEEGAIYIRPKKESYSPSEALEMVTMIGEARADECGIQEGWVRLWWD